jgi:hypothetical protein
MITNPFSEGTYEPDLLQVMADTYDSACKLLPVTDDPASDETARARVARHIMAAVAAGERDPEMLRTVAFIDGGVQGAYPKSL